MRSRSGWKCLSLALTVVVTGCGPKLTMEDLKQMRPQRPAALDKLDVFVGSWKTEGTANFIGMDETVRVSGTTTTEWQGDKWYLVENSEYSMEGMDPFKATAIWGYEDSRNRFRVFGLENMGNVASGTLMHHERRNIWTMRTRGSGPMGSTRGRGTIEFLDANTMLWCWSDYARWDVFRLFKLAEFGGTSTRM